jgi:hypothetical protein
MVKPITKTIRIFSALLLVVLGGAMLWLQSGPHALPWIKTKLLSQLHAAQNDYKIEMDSVVIDWRDITRLGTITIKRVIIRDGDGDAFAKLPEIDVELSFWNLLTRANSVKRVVVHRPRVYLAREEDGRIFLGIDEQRASLPIEDFFAHLSGDSEQSGARIPFDVLEIRNAHFQLRQAASEALLKSKRFSALMKREGSAYALQFSMPIKDGDTASLIEGSARRASQGDGWSLNTRFEALPVRWVCQLVPCDASWAFDGSVSGKLSAESDAALRIERAGVTGAASALKVALPEYFAEALTFDKAVFSARLEEGMSRIVLDQARVHLPEGTELAAVADMAYSAEHGLVGALQAETGRFPVEALYKYWPLNMSSQSRQWAITNLKKGVASRSEIIVTLEPGATRGEVFPDDALYATIETEGIEVTFLPKMPPVTTSRATVYFTGKTMQVKAAEATALSATRLQNIALLAPDLNHPNTPMEVQFSVDASASDAAVILQSPYLTFDDAAQLDPKAISGRASATLDIAFDAYTGKTASLNEIDLSAVRYDITANTYEIAQRSLIRDVDVADANVELALSNDDLLARGNMSVSGFPLKFTLLQEQSAPMQLTASGALGHEQLAALGASDVPYIASGVAHADITAILENGAIGLRSATLDVKDAAIAIPEIGWQKPQGVAGKLSMTSQGDDYVVDAHADDLVARGQLRFEAGVTSALKRADFDTIRTEHNDFALTYTREDSGFSVDLRGKRLDISNSYAQNDNRLLTDFPPIRLNIDLEQFVLAPAASLNAIKGYLNCQPDRCAAASVNGRANDAMFAARIFEKEGARTLSIQADDAGDLMRALNITDRVYNGKLSLKGNYDDSTTPPVFQGRLLLTDYVVKNSPILARLFTIGSLSGLANALDDSGITFDKMAIDLESSAGKILVKKGKANGNAVGATTEGMVDTGNANIHLKGVLVPAFFINSLVNNIPLIGELAGGEGEGLIAFRYTIDGAYDDPQVTVNPLSGLTPGFMRGFFDIFDRPVPKALEEKIEPAPSEAREDSSPSQP